MRPNEGDTVCLTGFGRCEIVSTADPSLVTVRLPSGHCIRIGDKALANIMEPSRNTESDHVPAG